MFPLTSLAERGQRPLPPPLFFFFFVASTSSLLSGLVTHHLCSTKLGLHISITCVLNYRFVLLSTPELRTPQLSYLFLQFISVRRQTFLPQNSESHHNRPSPSTGYHQPSNRTHPLAGFPFPAPRGGPYPIASMATS